MLKYVLTVGVIVAGGSFVAWLLSFFPSIRRVENASSPKPERKEEVAAGTLYDQYVSPWERAIMATFVANITGYGVNASYFSGLRRTLAPNGDYHQLITRIESVRSRLQLPTWGNMTIDDRERLVVALQEDNNFILICSYTTDFLRHAADQCSVVNAPNDEAIPEMYIPRDEVIKAFSEMYLAMWSPASAAN